MKNHHKTWCRAPKMPITRQTKAQYGFIGIEKQCAEAKYPQIYTHKPSCLQGRLRLKGDPSTRRDVIISFSVPPAGPVPERLAGKATWEALTPGEPASSLDPTSSCPLAGRLAGWLTLLSFTHSHSLSAKDPLTCQLIWYFVALSAPNTFCVNLPLPFPVSPLSTLDLQVYSPPSFQA
ncbi:unnamed protein product [Protopolystoma xenopodis]|uniref:Uncharacterized protein n=1 Tax=Protopolystoma xenopodis TaxID=117903 RepID=A0A3S5ANV3_9PLAT|nr:unnamed protein product [Protopolystoma xenopodis]